MEDVVAVFFWASAVRLAAPMFIAAIGETIAERAGVFNLGIEGMMLIGAFVGVAGTTVGGNPVTGVILAVAVTSGVGLLYGVIVAGFRADQVVTGIAFNIIAVGVTSLLRRTWLSAQSGGGLGSTSIPGLERIPFVGPVFFSQSPLVYVAFVVLPIVAFYLARTRSGLLLRAVGEHASAADSAGVRVIGYRIGALTFAGAMAGLAGAYLSVVATGGVFIDNMTLGRGFLAIAITIFARWNPWTVALASLFFGAAEALQFSGQSLFGGAIPPPLLLMLPFVLTLVAWAIVGMGGGAPNDLGRPFLRGRQ